MKLKPIAIFYFLVFYTIAQLTWWGILLIQLQPARVSMVIGEMMVFLTIFGIGVYRLHRGLAEEKARHMQQKNFLLSVTHELKSPLASIKLYLQTIQKRELDAVQRKSFISKSLLDIERLDDLVENMLIATKIENKSYSFPKEEFDFSELVEQVVSRLQVNKCNGVQQTIRPDVEPGVMIRGDRFALTSVVTNLIENAIKYSAPCQEIDVQVFTKNGQQHLRVADRGIGIDDLEKAKIFTKFYRVGSEETRKTKGTGLGLFIVKQVLDNHQASIKVQNNTPNGTIFDVAFSSAST
ncbi:MAG: GHKL domain-containing protein [Mucilaginibacter polytrichastri]|nr:GHKL domain-containing protein [Mucilaginibacter polytrichastri]